MLLFSDGDPGSGSTMEAEQIGVVLGRGRKATVSLHDSSRRLSRRHARLDLCVGKVFVTDLESMNGVIVNASRIDGSAQIESESLVQFGGAEIRVVGMIRC